MSKLCMLTGLSALVLGGCVAGNAPPTAGGRRVTYTCERGPGMTVTYGGGVARVDGGNGQTIILRRKESNDGFWYESESHRLRGKGNQIIFARAWGPRGVACHA